MQPSQNSVGYLWGLDGRSPKFNLNIVISFPLEFHHNDFRFRNFIIILIFFSACACERVREDQQHNYFLSTRICSEQFSFHQNFSRKVFCPLEIVQNSNPIIMIFFSACACARVRVDQQERADDEVGTRPFNQRPHIVNTI